MKILACDNLEVREYLYVYISNHIDVYLDRVCLMLLLSSLTFLSFNEYIVINIFWVCFRTLIRAICMAY